MRLARKLALALVLGIFAVMAGYAYIQVRQEVSFFETDLQAHALRQRVLFATVRSLWRTEGPERTRELVTEIAASVLGDAVDVRWVRLDAGAGDPAHARLAAEEVAALSAGDVVRLIRRTETGEMRRYTFIPMAVGDPHVLECSESLQREMTFIRMSHIAMLLATVLVAVVCGLIALGLGVRFVGRPIQLLRDQAHRMGAGDFSRRLQVRQRDEIGELSADMNLLCDRLVEGQARLAVATEARIATLEQLRHTDRLATVGQLASGVAHELGTPLSVVAARAALLGGSDLSPAEVADSARTIAEQSDRMTGIIRQLLDFSRRRGPQLGTADLHQLVARTVDLVSSAAYARRVAIDVAAGPGPLLTAVDQNQLQQALTHVIVNAIQSMPHGGRVTIRVSSDPARPPADRGKPAGDYLCVSVEDEGTGIAPENVPRVFEPFFTTKDVGEGTGLGLSVSYGIVAEHGGWIEVASEVGKGSRFSIFLPPAPSPRVERREVIA